MLCHLDSYDMIKEKQKYQFMNYLKVYTPDEARRILRIGRSRVYELLRSGELRSVKNGRRFLIPESCINEYLTVQTFSSQEAGERDAW